MPGTVLEALAVHNVPFIPHQRIERRANRLIARYFEKRGKRPGPPIPIESIVVNDLGYSLSYGNLSEEIGPGVLGAVLEEQQEVRINEELADDDQEGRHNFTLTHEAGHIVLHKDCLKQTNIFQSSSAPAVVCRDSSSEPIELQANKFAAYLLMPEEMVIAALRDLGDFEFSAGAEYSRIIAAGKLAPLFRVSRQSMEIRLKGLGCFVRREDQDALF